MKYLVLLAFAMALGAVAQQPEPQFEVATIKQVEAGPKDGRLLRMSNDHTFLAKNLTLKQLIAAAYDVNPSSISGATGWMDSQKFMIEARTPGETFPPRPKQMAMLRNLLQERFHLVFHRESKVMACYELTVAKDGPKVQPAKSDEYMPQVTSMVYPDHLLMPAKNASMDDFVKVLQRSILDHPVVDKTGMAGRYDFTLEWAPDESQFDGSIHMPEDTKSPPLLVAIREQLGLDLRAARGPVETLIVDSAAKPDDN
jgi:uncharacterized protein (TIGR03435 family)